MSNLISIWPHVIVAPINQLGWLIGFVSALTENPRCMCPWQRGIFFVSKKAEHIWCFHIDMTSLMHCCAVPLRLCPVLIVWLSPRPGTVLTVQALSEDDHKFWMQAMGGKEPVSQPPLLCHHPLLSHSSCSHSVLYSVKLPISFHIKYVSVYLHLTEYHKNSFTLMNLCCL